MSKDLTLDEIVSRIQFFCAKQERCTNEVREKLLQYGTQEDEIDELISKLIESRFLNEDRYAKAYAHDKITIQKWGKVKVKHMLRSKKVGDSIIDNALKEIDNDLYLAILEKVLLHKSATISSTDSYQKKQKLYKYLLSRGFESYLISETLKVHVK